MLTYLAPTPQGVRYCTPTPEGLEVQDKETTARTPKEVIPPDYPLSPLSHSPCSRSQAEPDSEFVGIEHHHDLDPFVSPWLPGWHSAPSPPQSGPPYQWPSPCGCQECALPVPIDSIEQLALEPFSQLSFIPSYHWSSQAPTAPFSHYTWDGVSEVYL